jgi:excisionase family DNA binding protein
VAPDSPPVAGLTAAEAAKRLNCTVYSVWRAINRGQLRVVMGKRRNRLISVASVESARAYANRPRRKTDPVFAAESVG